MLLKKKRENQRRETDQSSSQERGYAMLTPRTMMVISIKVLVTSAFLTFSFAPSHSK